MCFLDILARLDAHELGHETVEDIFVVFGLIGIWIVKQTKFEQFRIGKIVESKEIGAGFFKSRAVSLESIGVNTGEQTARGMSKTFVKVCVEIVGDEEIFVHEVGCLLVNHKFLVESVAVRSLVVGLSDVFKRHRFRTVGGTNPVGIGEIDADRSGGI